MLNIKHNVLSLIRICFIVCLFTGLFFSSCSYKQNQLLFEQTNAVPDSVYQKIRANISGYLIKPQDILEIKNAQESKNLVDMSAGGVTNTAQSTATQQSETYEVDVDGTIALTGIGRVPIAGLTRIEARKHIEDIYNKTFLKNALFDVKIINLKVTVLGEVRAPGNYSLTRDNTRLVDILGDAGGLTDKANEKNIKVIRGNEQNPDITVVDLSNVKELYNAKTILTNNDVIYVAQNKNAIRTQKVQSFSVVVQPMLLMINTALIIFTLARQ